MVCLTLFSFGCAGELPNENGDFSKGHEAVTTSGANLMMSVEDFTRNSTQSPADQNCEDDACCSCSGLPGNPYNKAICSKDQCSSCTKNVVTGVFDCTAGTGAHVGDFYDDDFCYQSDPNHRATLWSNFVDQCVCPNGKALNSDGTCPANDPAPLGTHYDVNDMGATSFQCNTATSLGGPYQYDHRTFYAETTANFGILTNISSTAGLLPNMKLSGLYIAPNTIISSVGTSSVQMNQSATGSTNGTKVLITTDTLLTTGRCSCAASFAWNYSTGTCVYIDTSGGTSGGTTGGGLGTAWTTIQPPQVGSKPELTAPDMGWYEGYCDAHPFSCPLR